MSTSTNGLLWFGIGIDGSPEDGDEFAERVHEILYGLEEDEDELYGDGREWMAATGITGVEFVEHCSDDYPMYGLAVAGTVVVAHRGYPQRVSIEPPPDPTPVLVALKALGITPGDDAIGWYLASMWS